MDSLALLRQRIASLKNSERAQISLRFFKTGPGQYGEGDRFLGLTVPQTRTLAKTCGDLAQKEVDQLMYSPWHEERLLALFILIAQFKKGSQQRKEEIYHYYLASTHWINNWDLVDTSARDIVGVYLLDRPREVLFELARSKSLWERRIAIIATFAFIRCEQYQDSMKLVELLMLDQHDLMHKACGWVLREIGKKNLQVLENFLQRHYRHMPRTMLRYAIERFPEEVRKKYLLGSIPVLE